MRKDALTEIAAGVLTLLGWVSVTVGVYTIVPHVAVLLISAGILGVGVLGWRVVLALLLDGIYAAAKLPDGEGGA